MDEADPEEDNPTDCTVGSSKTVNVDCDEQLPDQGGVESKAGKAIESGMGFGGRGSVGYSTDRFRGRVGTADNSVEGGDPSISITGCPNCVAMLPSLDGTEGKLDTVGANGG